MASQITENDFHQQELELLKEYEELKPKLIEWGQFAINTLKKIFEENGFPESKIQIFTHRLKADKSVIKNAFYRTEEIKNSSAPLKRIQDKFGIRIVVTNLMDAKKVMNIVTSHSEYWKSRISRAPDKFLNTPKVFDYQSIHVNLSPTKKVKCLENLTKKQLEYYICELQIRTLLQHAFAEVAHDTIYKGAYGEDAKIVRLLSRSMALMEVTDDSFCRAYEMMEEENTYEDSFIKRIIDFYNEKIGDGATLFDKRKFDTTLTTEILHKFDAKSVKIEELERIVTQKSADIKRAITGIRSYLKTEPIIIFILYLIYADEYTIREDWYLDEDILKELFFRLGISYDR